MFEEIKQLLEWRALERAAQRSARGAETGIMAGVRKLSTLCPADGLDDGEAPIFFLSAGWRSGSTLMQRLIMSDSRVLLWGEPYQESGLIQHLAESARAFRADWPKPKWFYRGNPPSELTGAWVANLFPQPGDWRSSQRSLLDGLFAVPARRAGALRWGIKEVRLTVEHAFYLRWLYPRSRFVFLYRNPLDAYLSYRRRGGGWYNTYPDQPVFTPTAFGRHWRELMEGFLRHGAELDALFVRFEDLIQDQAPIASLEAHLAIRVDPAVLATRLDGADPAAQVPTLGRLESLLLKRAVNPVAESLGYDW